jgi:hypothetical protein
MPASKPLACIGVADGGGEEGEAKSQHHQIKHGILLSIAHASAALGWDADS